MGVGEVAKLVKCFLHKHEDLMPSTHVKTKTRCGHVCHCNPRSGEAKTGGPLVS